MRNDFRLKSLGDLPNQEGYRFVGVTKDGLEVPCTVAKENGLCYVKEFKDCFNELVGWIMTMLPWSVPTSQLLSQ